MTCTVKLFSNVQLELTCSSNGVESPLTLTFEVYSIKLEMNYYTLQHQ